MACALGFVVALSHAVYLAFLMPVFTPLDETYHADYALKLYRGVPAHAGSRLEPDVMAALKRGLDESEMFFHGRTSEPVLVDLSYQTYHPPLAYWFGAACLAAFDRGDGDVHSSVVTLRISCAVLSALGRCVLFLAIAGLSTRAALVAWPIVFLMAMPSLSRFSNDALCLLLGSAAFYLCVKPRQTSTSITATALILVAAVMTKQTGFLLAVPMVGLVAATAWRPAPSVRQLAGLLLPAVVVAVGWEISNIASGRGLGGTAHLDAVHFPAPSMRPGGAFAALLVSPTMWLRLHGNLLLDEMPWHGLRNPSPMAHGLLLLMQQAGLALLAWRGLQGLWTKRWSRPLVVGLALMAATIVMLYGTAFLFLSFGRVYWSSRQFVVVLAATIVPMVLGWSFLIRGARPWRVTVRWVVFVLMTVGCAMHTWGYLR